MQQSKTISEPRFGLHNPKRSPQTISARPVRAGVSRLEREPQTKRLDDFNHGCEAQFAIA